MENTQSINQFIVTNFSKNNDLPEENGIPFKPKEMHCSLKIVVGNFLLLRFSTK